MAHTHCDRPEAHALERIAEELALLRLAVQHLSHAFDQSKQDKQKLDATLATVEANWAKLEHLLPKHTVSGDALAGPSHEPPKPTPHKR